MIPLIYEDDDAATRLATLALTVENLVAALMAGDAEARAWTEAAPANMSGMARGSNNEAIRIGLAKKSKDWTYRNPRNLPLTINEPIGVAIVATSGDGGTAIRSGHPAPSTPRALRSPRPSNRTNSSRCSVRSMSRSARHSGRSLPSPTA